MIKIYVLLKNYNCDRSGLDSERVVYVGQSKNVERRIKNHKDKDFDRYLIARDCNDLGEAKEWENFYIKKYDPKYNKSLNFYGNYGTIKELIEMNKMHGFKINFDDLTEIMSIALENDLKPLFNDKYSYMNFYKILNKWQSYKQFGRY